MVQFQEMEKIYCVSYLGWYRPMAYLANHLNLRFFAFEIQRGKVTVMPRGSTKTSTFFPGSLQCFAEGNWVCALTWKPKNWRLTGYSRIWFFCVMGCFSIFPWQTGFTKVVIVIFVTTIILIVNPSSSYKNVSSILVAKWDLVWNDIFWLIFFVIPTRKVFLLCVALLQTPSYLSSRLQLPPATPTLCLPPWSSPTLMQYKTSIPVSR